MRFSRSLAARPTCSILVPISCSEIDGQSQVLVGQPQHEVRLEIAREGLTLNVGRERFFLRIDPLSPEDVEQVLALASARDLGESVEQARRFAWPGSVDSGRKGTHMG